MSLLLRHIATAIVIALSGIPGPQSAFAQPSEIKIVTNVAPNAVYAAVFSPDGTLLMQTHDGSVSLWDVASSRLLRSIKAPKILLPTAIAISPDNRMLAMVGESEIRRDLDPAALMAPKIQNIDLRDSRSGRVLRSINAHAYAVYAVAFSPDGKYVLSGGSNEQKYKGNVGPIYAPLKLWDVATGRLIRVYKGHADHVTAVAFSPDSQSFVSGSQYDKTVKVWDIGSETPKRSFDFGAEDMSQVSFVAGGRAVLAGGGPTSRGLVKTWDVATGKPLQTLSRGPFRKVGITPDGGSVLWPPDYRDGTKAASLISLATGQGIRQIELPSWGWNYGGLTMEISPNGRDYLLNSKILGDVASGRRLNGRSHAVQSIAFALDDNLLITGGDGGRVWDLSAGRVVRQYDEPQSEARELALLSPDGARLVWTYGEKLSGPPYTQYGLKVRNVADGRLLKTIRLPGPVQSGVFLRNPSELAVTITHAVDPHAAQQVHVIDLETGAVKRRMPAGGGAYLTLAGSPDRSKLLLVSSDNFVRSYEASSGAAVLSESAKGKSFHYGGRDLAVSPDGTKAVSGGAGAGRAVIWNADTGALIQQLEGHNAAVVALAFSPDGKRVASGSEDLLVSLWDADTGRRIRSFDGHTSPISAVTFSRDGKRIVSASEDTTSRIWDVDTGALIAVLVSGNNGEWLILTPEGFFAGSERSADLLSVVRGLDNWSIDQFYQSLYRPDLVREKLVGDPRGLVRDAAARLDLGRVLASGDAPTVRLVSPADRTAVAQSQVGAEIEITPSGGGIGRVEWRVNGVTVGIEAPTNSLAGQPLRLTRGLVLEEGDSEIEVVAYNGQNLVASVPARVTVTAPAAAGASPRLFLLAVGLNEYEDKEIQLKYAVPDATALAEALEKAGHGVYESMQVTLLKDAEVRRENLDATFRKLAAAVRPSDVFVFFVAGHGKTIDGRYYFIPQDVKLDGNASVVKQGIAQEEWQRWFASIPARKSVLLFDTCESGSLTGDGFETRALERGAASDRLVQATGRTILTATSDTSDAFEGYRGHGLFTYNLLDALGSADSDRNGTVELPELAAFVHAQVTSLSEKVFQKRQVPQVRISGNYPIAKTTRIVAEAPADIVVADKPTHMVGSAADLLVQPINGARRVRKLDAKTPLTLVRNEGGWTLVAREGKPIGYVATRDLSPLQ